MLQRFLSGTFIKVFVAVFVVGLAAVTWSQVAQAAISNVSITPVDSISSHDTAYDFSFDTNVATKTKTITINFPSGYVINNGNLGSLGDSTDVICSNNCDWAGFVSVGTGEDESLLPVASVVQISTRVLKISLNSSADLSEGTVFFHINSGYIRNPNASGSYNVSIKSGTDTTPVNGVATITYDNDSSNFENYGHINISVNNDTITADDTATFTVHAYDQYGNDMGDVSNSASYDISDGAAGSFTGSVYNPHFVGEWLVTANYGGHSDSQWINVNPGVATSLYVEESPNSYYRDNVSSSIYPGGSRHVYSVYRDQFDNFVSNPAVTWSLINKTAGVADGDLVADEDGKGAVFTGNLVGSAEINAYDGTWGFSAPIDVISYSLNDTEHFGHITISPSTDAITSDQTIQYFAEAFDSHNNSLGDVTSSTTFSIQEGGDNGYFDGSTYHPSNAGAWTVEGNYNGYTDTATLTVNGGVVDHIIVNPTNSTITAGATETYSVLSYDSHNNYLGYVTGDSTFSVLEGGDNGSFTNEVYTSSKAGSWTVQASYDGHTSTSDLTVNPGAPAAIVMGPDTDTISTDDSEAFTVNAYDAESNFIGDVTMSTDFSITGGNSGNGSMIDNLFSSHHPDTYTVQASYGGKTDTSSITVTHGGLDHFDVSGITDPIVAGVPTSVTITAKDQYGNTVTDYQGTAVFSSSDDAATLPSNYSFLGGDNGTKTFTNGVTFETAGEQSVTAADIMSSELEGSQSNVTVQHAALDHFKITPSKLSLAKNENFSFTIQALDIYGNEIGSANGGTAFTGVVTIDTNATLPNVISNSTTFISGDNGVKTLSGQSFGVDQVGVTISATNGSTTGVSQPITVSGVLATPGTSVPVDTYYTTKNVTLSATGSSSIHYTVDGVTQPTCSTGSTTFPISVSSTKTIKAIACYTGGQSAVVDFSYVINPATAPSPSPAAGIFTSTQSVTLSAGTGVSSIRYNIGSTAPTCSSGTLYTGAISVSTTSTIKAVACYPGTVSSEVTTLSYTIRRSSGGGGGGGGGSTHASTVTAPIVTTTPVTSVVPTDNAASAVCKDLTRMLRLGVTGTDVKSLQILLSISADGSFGPGTDRAVRAYQSTHALNVDGIVGPLTYAKMKAAYCAVSVGSGTNGTSTPTVPVSVQPSTTTVSTTHSSSFPRVLKQGMTGADVMLLQKLLNKGVGTQIVVTGPGSPGMETNLFGPATTAAVKKFQLKFGLPADGIVGPQTIVKLLAQ